MVKRRGEKRISITSRPLITGGPLYSGHMRDELGRQAKFQLVLERRGQKRTTDLRITASELQRLGLEASFRNLSISELMCQVIAKAIKKKKIHEILRADLPGSQA